MGKIALATAVKSVRTAAVVHSATMTAPATVTKIATACRNLAEDDEVVQSAHTSATFLALIVGKRFLPFSLDYPK